MLFMPDSDPPNQLRTHNRDHFYKYMSAQTGLAVLINCTLRWSSPTEFNDPFDVPRELAYGVEPKEIRAEVSRFLLEAIQDPSIPIGQYQPHVQVVIQLVRSRPDQAREEIAEFLKEQMFVAPNDSDGLEELRQWWRDTIPNFRILCLSDTHESASMWHHYATQYKGVVIKVLCSDQLDSPWLMAKPVNYPDEPPQLYTAAGWADFILRGTRRDGAITEVLDSYTYNKKREWRSEEEWRLTSFKRDSEEGTYSDYPLNNQHFLEVYLGPKISAEDREAIVDIVRKKHPHVKIYETTFEAAQSFAFHEV